MGIKDLPVEGRHGIEQCLGRRKPVGNARPVLELLAQRKRHCGGGLAQRDASSLLWAFLPAAEKTDIRAEQDSNPQMTSLPHAVGSTPPQRAAGSVLCHATRAEARWMLGERLWQPTTLAPEGPARPS